MNDLYIFGGQDDENNKLGDFWKFSSASKQWEQIQFGENDFKPCPRSGHCSIVHGDKMFIFGGILELTKELNEMVVYDFKNQKFSSND